MKKQMIISKLEKAESYISTEPDKCLIYIENAIKDIKDIDVVDDRTEGHICVGELPF